MSRTFKIVLALLVAASIAASVVAVIGFMGKEREYMKRLVVEDKLAITLKEKRNIEKELEAAKSAKEQSDTNISKMEEKLKNVSAQFDVLKSKTETAAIELESKEKELVRIKADLDNEKKEKLTISKKLDTLQTDYDRVKKQVSMLTNDKIDLEKKVQELQEKQSVNLDKIVVGQGEKTASMPISKPVMQGKVLVVNKEYSFIVADIGQDKNVQKGARFDVMDGARSLGQVEVDKVYDTMSSATVLPGAKINDMKKGNVIVEIR
ncbi:MAG: hypothetical protein Q8O12_00590 [Candidatus Omnitrophota bacterium]|nr:hypothetical protein [Candidatus Omnitrophota bacterium]